MGTGAGVPKLLHHNGKVGCSLPMRLFCQSGTAFLEIILVDA